MWLGKISPPWLMKAPLFANVHKLCPQLGWGHGGDGIGQIGNAKGIRQNAGIAAHKFWVTHPGSGIDINLQLEAEVQVPSGQISSAKMVARADPRL